jgi:hypothetical protein
MQRRPEAAKDREPLATLLGDELAADVQASHNVELRANERHELAMIR